MPLLLRSRKTQIARDGVTPLEPGRLNSETREQQPHFDVSKRIDHLCATTYKEDHDALALTRVMFDEDILDIRAKLALVEEWTLVSAYGYSAIAHQLDLFNRIFCLDCDLY